MNPRHGFILSMFRRCLFLTIALTVAAAARVGPASAVEYAYIPTGLKLTVLDAKSFLPIGTIPLTVTSLPAMALAPVAKRVYYYDADSHTIHVIDALGGQEIDTITFDYLWMCPRGIAASADGKRLYFAALEKGLVAVDLERKLLMGEFVPGAYRVIAHPTLDKLWVASSSSYGAGLYIMRASDMTVLKRLDDGGDLALSADGSRLYVAGGGRLRIYNAATDELIKVIALPASVDYLAVGGRWAYVANMNAGVLGVVDLAGGHFEKNIPLEMAGMYGKVKGVDATADGSRVVVMLAENGHNYYAVVDGVNHTLIGIYGGASDGLCDSKYIMRMSIPESSFTVNSTADATDASPGDGVCETGTGNGICTLRAAVQEANAAAGPAVVDLPAGEYYLSIPGADEDQAASGDLDVLGVLTIRGAGSDVTVIDASALDRVLQVNGGLRLEGVTVRNGYLTGGDGAGILNGGALAMRGVTVLNNRAVAGVAGVQSMGAPLRAYDSTFSGNISDKGTKGCAIAAGYAEVKRCLVTGNTGLLAVRIYGLLGDSVVRDNDAAGVEALSVLRCTISGNLGRGCSKAGLIEDSTISGNVNEEPGACGGGVYFDRYYGRLVIRRSTISGNTAAMGGGICNDEFDIENSTISGNSATGSGGGIYIPSYYDRNYIRNCTITANTADSDDDGAGDGGGVFSGVPPPYNDYHTDFFNTILAGNGDWGGEAPDCSGYLGSGQFNIVGNTAGCGFEALAEDVTGSAAAPVDPMLGPLADNGGPTMTHALLAGSPAIDAGHPYVFPATDQRGVVRPQDGDDDGTAVSDIGAFELAKFWTITAAAGTGGSISPAGAVGVPNLGSRTFAITPAEHYHVTNVLVDGVSVGRVRSWTFNGVVAGHTITASFAINTHTIAASAGPHGTITPSGPTTVPGGGSRTFVITPAPHYHVAGVLVDGVPVGRVRSWTFSDVDRNHTIVASFAINTRTVATSAGVRGKITPAGVTVLPYGGYLTVLVTPLPGYRVAHLYVNGVDLGPRSRYTISYCTRNYSIRATFM